MFVLAGDVHGNGAHLRWILAAAAEAGAETVYQLGDFGYWEHRPEGVRYLDEADRWARSAGIPVVFVDGNHDNSALLLGRYGHQRDDRGLILVRSHLRYAPRGHRWTDAGLRFLAFGGAFSPDREWRLAEERRRHRRALRKEGYRRAAGRPPAEVPDFAGTLWFPEEEATDADVERVLADRSPVDVLLTHDKPFRTAPAVNRKADPRCRPNQERVQRIVDTLRPALAAHGHLHHRYTEDLVHGDGAVTRVEGLGADPHADAAATRYHAGDSCLVIDGGSISGHKTPFRQGN